MMKKTTAKLPQIKLVGIKVRTKNVDELNPKTAKIGQTLANYFENNLSEKIGARLSPGKTYCVYTEFESDENGCYTYFVGEEVSSLDDIDPTLSALVIPASSYTKLECGPGVMPALCIDAWQKIWGMSAQEIGGERSYIADFEIYDQRAQDPKNTVFDLYLGLK